MKKKTNSAILQEYFEDSALAGKCPWCKSISIEGQSVVIEGRFAVQEISCTSCGKEWKETYELVEVTKL